MTHQEKQKLKSTLTIMITMVAVITAIALYNAHEDARRLEYAEHNNCTWTTYASHDICK